MKIRKTNCLEKDSNNLKNKLVLANGTDFQPSLDKENYSLWLDVSVSAPLG